MQLGLLFKMEENVQDFVYVLNKYMCIQTYMCGHTQNMCAHTHTHTHTHTRTYTLTNMRACTHKHAHKLKYIICVYVYIYVYIYIYTEQVLHPDMLYSENNIKKFHNSFTQPCLMFRNDVSITIQVCTYQNWNVIFSTLYITANMEKLCKTERL